MISLTIDVISSIRFLKSKGLRWAEIKTKVHTANYGRPME